MDGWMDRVIVIRSL